MSTHPVAWLENVEEVARELCEIPLWGNAPSFPWDALSKHLEEKFQVGPIKLAAKETKWLPSDQLLNGLGNAPMLIDFEMAPLEGKLQWAMGAEDLSTLSDLFLTTEKGSSLADRRLQEGFYQYLCLKITAAFAGLRPFGDLSLRMGNRANPIVENALCLDVSIKIKTKTLWGRVICPSSFLHTFRTHFSTMASSPLEEKKCAALDLRLRIEVGSTEISSDEWSNVAVGDFVLLDRCTYDVDAHKGSTLLTLHERPLFHARLKEQQLKILDYVQQMEETAMTSPEEDLPQETPPDQEMPPPEEGTVPEEEMEQETASEVKAEGPGVDKIVAADSVPLTLRIELGSLQMNLASLLKLAPGNVVEFSARPEEGVDVMLHGKRVARAELVKVGEAMGLKILQIHR